MEAGASFARLWQGLGPSKCNRSAKKSNHTQNNHRKSKSQIAEIAIRPCHSERSLQISAWHAGLARACAGLACEALSHILVLLREAVASEADVNQARHRGNEFVLLGLHVSAAVDVRAVALHTGFFVAKGSSAEARRLCPGEI